MLLEKGLIDEGQGSGMLRELIWGLRKVEISCKWFYLLLIMIESY